MTHTKALGLILSLACVVDCMGAGDNEAPYHEIGCFSESSPHDLDHLGGWLDKASPEACLKSCSGYPFFSIQEGQICMCGNSFGKYGQLGHAECTQKCSADAKYLCGGKKKATVYLNHNYENSWSDASYSGCLKWNSFPAADRVKESGMTIKRCHDICQGSTHFILSNGDTCDCASNPSADSVDVTGQCTTKCAGDEKKTCGGDNAFDVYEFSESMPACRADQMSQKKSKNACWDSCAASSSCSTVGYSESSKTCILMTTQCKPPASAGDVSVNLLPVDFVPGRGVTEYEGSVVAMCPHTGFISEPRRSTYSLEGCKKHAVSVPEAKYFNWGTKSRMCSLFKSCDGLVNGLDSQIVGGIGDVPKPKPADPSAGFEGPAPGENAMYQPEQAKMPSGFNPSLSVTTNVRLLDVKGKPMPFIPVPFYWSNGDLVAKSTTNPNGDIKVKLPPGQYTLKPEVPANRRPSAGDGSLSITVVGGKTNSFTLKTQFK